MGGEWRDGGFDEPARLQRPASLEAVRSLLSSEGLPVEDLREEHLAHFLVLGDEESPAGVVGIEPLGGVALLRSLAVRGASRRRGIGKALVMAAERLASERGAVRVYLLTTTAAGFFGTIGYAVVERDSVPEAIRATTEFASLCPQTATVMARDLGRGPERA